MREREREEAGNMREENERNEKAKVWSMCSQASVFSTIRLKFERGKGYLAHTYACVYACRESSQPGIGPILRAIEP